MAAPHSFTRDVETIVTTTLDYRVKEVADNIFIEYPLFDTLVKNREQGAGNRIEIPLEYTASTTNGYLTSDMATLTLENKDPLTYAFYPWVTYADALAVTIKELKQNQGGQKFFDILNKKIDNLINSIKDQIAKSWWAASPASTASNSIPSLINTAGTGTVGDIVSGSNTWWKNQFQSSVGSFAVNGRSKMGTLYNDCSKGMNSMTPDTIMTDQSGFENYELHLAARERINIEGPETEGGVGYDRLKFKRAWVYWDDYLATANGGPSTAADGRWYFLNTKAPAICLYTMEGAWMERGPMLEATDQLARSVKVYSMFNLCVSNRRFLGVLSGVTYP